MQAVISLTRLRLLIALRRSRSRSWRRVRPTRRWREPIRRTTGLRPDLRSAQITGFDSTTGATTIQVCFDKQIEHAERGLRLHGRQYRQAETRGRQRDTGCEREAARTSSSRRASSTRSSGRTCTWIRRRGEPSRPLPPRAITCRTRWPSTARTAITALAGTRSTRISRGSRSARRLGSSTTSWTDRSSARDRGTRCRLLLRGQDGTTTRKLPVHGRRSPGNLATVPE